ncbi:MAG: hypothetical protein KF763_13465 [Cyclobacteriaceae bacterium]|nr:hypothetical protein [Cyclobacteriaceae bacterium]
MATAKHTPTHSTAFTEVEFQKIKAALQCAAEKNWPTFEMRITRTENLTVTSTEIKSTVPVKITVGLYDLGW